EVTYYDYNNLNQLTTERVLGGEATYYTWTADGAMATKQEAAGWTYYTWDVDESLKRIEAPNVTLDNKYNARMQRVWRSDDGEAEYLVCDAQKLVAEVAAGGLERYYLSEGGSIYSPLVSQLGSQHWFLFDALGTSLGLADEAGRLSDTFGYEAFGTSLGRTGTTETPYQYVGGYGYFDEPGVGLEQVWNRWYTPAQGRFVGMDPVGSPPDYIYVGNNPAFVTDPSGMSPCPTFWMCFGDCMHGVWMPMLAGCLIGVGNSCWYAIGSTLLVCGGVCFTQPQFCLSCFIRGGGFVLRWACGKWVLDCLLGALIGGLVATIGCVGVCLGSEVLS
ncbi:MAG: RHS repeat-associated core domain-containing protein, partial [Armatimonadia bacterium]